MVLRIKGSSTREIISIQVFGLKLGNLLYLQQASNKEKLRIHKAAFLLELLVHSSSRLKDNKHIFTLDLTILTLDHIKTIYRLQATIMIQDMATTFQKITAPR